MFRDHPKSPRSHGCLEALWGLSVARPKVDNPMKNPRRSWIRTTCFGALSKLCAASHTGLLWRRAVPIILVMLLSAGGAAAQTQLPFAKSPPGKTSEIFAPGEASRPDRYEYCAAITQDGRTLYFGVELGTHAEIRTARWEGDGWSDSTAFLTHDRFSHGDPVLSLDGTRLYFISNRPLESGGGEKKDFDIWFVEREDDGWSEPRNLGPTVNSDFDEYNTSFAASGRIYFSSDRLAGERRGNFDVSSSEFRNGTFLDPEPVPGELNTVHYEADAYVTPDESMLVFASQRPDGLGRGDLYVSRRLENGDWGPGRSLGSTVNTEGHELCPLLIGGGRYLLFTSEKDLWWIDGAATELAP